jgi:hypothetical protein
MKLTTLARFVGAFVLLLGIVGLASGETRLFNLMNTDIALDLTRIALGVILLASSYRGVSAEKAAFGLFGIVYLANFLVAFISPTMFGFLPHMYGGLDNLLHLGGGALGLIVAFMPAERTHARHAI